MRKLFLFVLGALFVATPAFAIVTSKTFLLQANIPAATGSQINAFSINGTGTPVFTPVAGTTLSFNTGPTMPFDVPAGIYIPDHYFAIDVAGSGGAGSPDVTVTYSGDTKPAGQTTGLGVKATATFVKVSGSGATATETGITTAGPKKRLIDVNQTILKTAYAGGFLRIYLGVVTKDPAATFPDPANSEPFTNADVAGAYAGTFLISATVP